MAEVPAEAPAEGEAVAEVKIDSNLSSLRLTFPQENPLPTPCMDLTEYPVKVDYFEVRLIQQSSQKTRLSPEDM